MADAAASALVNVIVQNLADKAFKEYVRSQGIHSELKNLGRKLSQIQSVLRDASQKEVNDEAVKQWLNDLQHLAYDIDDVLDDVATEAMHRELTQESGATTSKVRKFIPTCCMNFALSHRLTHKLDSINKELQNLENQTGHLGLIVKDEKPKNTSRRSETSLLEPNVVGREEERERLLEKLLDDEPCKENFSVLPIVGMGGVGKTTLARLLYNDAKVKGHFELKSWVCVSNDFDTFKISETIIQSVTNETKEHKDLSQLQMAIIEQFKDKRFLLVLDDVWHENCDDWERLVRPFHFGAPGSKIIMTTRKDRLLKMLGFENLDYLNRLSDKDALSLLSIYALGVDNFDSHPTLIPTGEGIVEKCGGLPLALKAIGRLLRTKKGREDWDDVLKSEIWDLENIGDLSADWKAIFPALRLSYHDLSGDLKQLFIYSSLFPKDFLFDKGELVLLWMAEGYLNQSGTNKSPERLGHEYFEELLSRSFFQHAPNSESFFVMHDLMNDLATFLSKDFFLRYDTPMEKAREDLAKYRHMSFIREDYVGYKKFEAFKYAKSLRTLFAVSSGVDQSWKRFYLSNKILVDLVPQLPLLRVISLSRFEISEVTEFIGTLKQLRYLNLSQTKIKELPENVGNLYNLQTLIVFGCKELTKLPTSFSRLKRLRHLDIRDTPLLKELPLEIGELKSLQTLTKIVIGGDSGFAITKLKGLQNLHGKISIEGLHKVQSAMHAREANLSLKKLTKLELKWDDGFTHGTLEKEVLNELKPDSDWLKKLEIVSYGGIEFPNWVGDPSFRQLVQVSIRTCQNCTSLAPLGKLMSLKKLLIKGMNKVEVISSEFTGTSGVAFPSLEILEFVDMLEWKVWSTNNNVLDVFPYLRELKIKKCPELDNISLKAIPSLRVLKIVKCGAVVLRNMVIAALFITELAIDSILGLSYQVWRDVIKYIGTVEDITMERCNEIRYLWESEGEVSKFLVNLRKLEVSSCPDLVSLGEKEDEDNLGTNVLSSLRRLDVSFCENIERCCCPNSNNLERLTIACCKSLTRVSFPMAAEREGGQKLKFFDIQNCNEQMEMISNISMPLLEKVLIGRWTNLKSVIKLSNFIYLTFMHIYDCPSLKSFPDIPLPNLTDLSIDDCESLESFPCHRLTNLTLLKKLQITNCPSMDSSFPCGLWPPKLSMLIIGELKKPISEWGAQNFPTSLVDLILFGAQSHVSNFIHLSELFPTSLTFLGIYKFDELESLSMGLQHLTSLQHLHIDYCPKMLHLPKTLLPSLLSLGILESPTLKKWCNESGWPLISHIPCIEIRDSPLRWEVSSDSSYPISPTLT